MQADPIKEAVLPDNITVVVRISARCNLACTYCYARTSNRLGSTASFMAAKTASLVCEQFLSLPVKRVDFNWHGGEPLLCDPAVLWSALRTQQRLKADGRASATNKVQTNGKHVPDEWLSLLREHPIDIGISLDGPARFHNRHRKSMADDSSSCHEEVMANAAKLREIDLPFGTLLVITEDMAAAAKEVFDFITNEQLAVDLLPCFCRGPGGEVAPPSISPRSLARFVKEYFDEWIRHPDPPTCRMLEDILGGLLGVKPTTCAFRHNCHHFYSVDTEGRLYPCDLFLGQQDMCLGDLRSEPLSIILRSPRARAIRSRIAALPEGCSECNWLASCGGGCAAHRIGQKPNSFGRYYFCGARKSIFRHIEEFMAANADLSLTALTALRGRS
ncbi:MAG: radical SAM protein [Deltaproteobacteria bacterium]|nr:radical SAM protein [Deltaproteobacteria bacterium]